MGGGFITMDGKRWDVCKGCLCVMGNFDSIVNMSGWFVWMR